MPTSAARISDPAAGMTLFEVLLVLVLLASLGGMVIPRLVGALGNPLKNEVNKIGTLTRRLHYSAKLRQKTFRLAVDLNANTYWVEVGPAGTLLPGPDASPTPQTKDKDKAPQPLFSADPEFFKKPQPLPAPGKFEMVEVTGRKEPVREGMAYIHFFSTGLGDEAALHVTDGAQAHWTIAVHPLTGRVKVESKDVPLKDLAEQL